MSLPPDTFSFTAFIQLVLEALEAAQIRYLIGGAVGLAAWGHSRTTEDFDVVVDLPLESMAGLSKELEKRDMLVPADIMIDLWLNPRGDLAINAYHWPSGYKAELFMLRPGDLQRQQALDRRVRVDFGPPLGLVWVHAPEDLILYKLRYYAISRQTKHIRDIGSILHSIDDDLDWDYLNDWIARLQLEPIWFELLDEVDKLRPVQPPSGEG
jgi:hypothetical protein